MEEPEERGCRSGRSSTRSPDSGLDCGSEEEESRFNVLSGHETLAARTSPASCQDDDSSSSSSRPLLARRKTLIRQSSIEEDFGDPIQLFVDSPKQEDFPAFYKRKPEHQRCSRAEHLTHEDAQGDWSSSPLVENEARLTSLPFSKQPYRKSEAPPVCCSPIFLLTSACQITSFILKTKIFISLFPF